MQLPRRLSDWPWVVVRVDCKLCPRQGRYRLARLAHRFGSEMELETLLNELSADCPWNRPDRKPRPYEVQCGIRFADWDRGRDTKTGLPTDFQSRYVAMGATGPFTLGDLRRPRVTVVCTPCRRRGVYRVSGLVERFGAELPLPTLLTRLATGCPGLRETTPRCQAMFDPPPQR